MDTDNKGEIVDYIKERNNIMESTYGELLIVKPRLKNSMRKANDLKDQQTVTELSFLLSLVNMRLENPRKEGDPQSKKNTLTERINSSYTSIGEHIKSRNFVAAKLQTLSLTEQLRLMERRRREF